MADVSLGELRRRWTRKGQERVLLNAAASVANAIHVGAGGMIQGSMMEKEFRDALGLQTGEMVFIPKR